MMRPITVLFGMVAWMSVAASVTSQNMFGVLRVASRTAETVIAVPWQAAGGGEVAVADYVKTANLTPGDMLHAYDQATGAFTSWVLGPDKTWSGAVRVTTEGVTWTAGGKDSTLARGKALVLVRQNPAAGDIFLYGEVSASAAETKIVANAHNLLAPPCAADVDLNAADVMTGTPDADDVILLDLKTILSYNATDGKWGAVVYDRAQRKNVYDYAVAKVKAGTGAWYVSAGGTPTFTWVKAAGGAE